MEHAGIRGDFVERFNTFRNAYGRASSKEEKSSVTEQFLKNCTNDEITLMRNIIGNVLQNNRFNLPYKLFD